MSVIKCILYARVSTADQAETGYSLQSQEKLLKEYSERKGFRVEKIFSVSESASGQKRRKMFDEMITLLKKKGINIIVCEKVDRLTRNMRDAVLIDEWIKENREREVHFAKESWVLNKESKSADRFMWNVRTSTSQFYTDNLSEEVKKGQKEKIAQGWLPTRPPLGYKTVGERGHKIHIIDENKGPLVRKMFDLYSTGNYSVKKLVNVMYDLGLRTNGGNRFGKSRLASTLGDPFYYGKIRWNDVIYNGKQEPLISKGTFELVQNVLKSKTTPKYSKHLFLFKGLVKCAGCGGHITWETHKNNTYGHCNHRYHKCDQELWSKEREVENQVINILSGLKIKNSRIFEWVKKALLDSHKDKIEFHSSAIRELEQKLETIEKRLDRLYDDKLDEKIDPKTYDRKFQQYTQEKEEIIESMKNHTEADTRYLKLGMDFFELAQKAKEIYISIDSDVEKKRSLLHFIFKDLTLDEGILSYEFTEAFKLIAQATDFSNGSKMEKMAKGQDKNFEPAKNRLNNAQTDLSGVGFRAMLRGQDSNLQPIDYTYPNVSKRGGLYLYHIIKKII